MRVAVIGAGAAGLNSARHVLANGFECIVFEQTDQIGGTWVYTDETGIDKYGMPVHTSMYQNLRTNLPKEVMGFPDFPIPECDKSYLPQKDILEFLEQYADRYEIKKCIKFYHHVNNVHPLPGDRWEINVIDVRTKEQDVYEFDAIMVCNGHYHTPNIPKLEGIETFEGVQLHSHDYRKAEQFRGQRVVIIGAGPSGVDLAFHIADKAIKVILSHHLKEPINTKFPKHVMQKPDIKRISGKEVIFKDDSVETIDALFYCTGFNYTFPFLSKECGIEVDDNFVKPLYKHLINIEHPTMALVGLPFYVCAFQMFDIQTRFFVASLNGHFKLPSKENMFIDMNLEMENRWQRGLHKRYAHSMGVQKEGLYFNDLADTAAIDRVPQVMIDIHVDLKNRMKSNLINYRDDIYRIIDDEHFEVKYAS